MRKISFTGSTEVGKELIRLSADQVKRLSLELGGHAPYVIFDDADLDEAVDGLIASKFRNAGQTCVCANRTYVQSGIYDDFVERARARRSTQMVVGHGTDDGRHDRPADRRAARSRRPTSTSRTRSRHGARLVVGGERLTGGEFAGGSFYAPTVLEGVTPEMLISHEETFGPVAGVTRFETEEEAIRLANDTVYGLAAYFHTRDYARLLRVAEKLEYGIVGANAGHHQRRERAVRRRQGVRLRTRGRRLRDRRVPRRQVRPRRRRRDLGQLLRRSSRATDRRAAGCVEQPQVVAGATSRPRGFPQQHQLRCQQAAALVVARLRGQIGEEMPEPASGARRKVRSLGTGAASGRPSAPAVRYR